MPLKPVFMLMFVLIFAIMCPVVRAQKKSELNFPTDDEIKLLITQTDRAIQIYKPLLDEQSRLPVKNVEMAVEKDRGVLAALELAIKVFETNPQGFNGPLGFAFFEWIDDAGRNALLCSFSASNEAVSVVTEGKKGAIGPLTALSRRCLDVSTLLYTVSENAGALYTRYVKGEEKLAIMGAEAAKQCADTLKKK